MTKLYFRTLSLLNYCHDNWCGNQSKNASITHENQGTIRLSATESLSFDTNNITTTDGTITLETNNAIAIEAGQIIPETGEMNIVATGDLKIDRFNTTANLQIENISGNIFIDLLQAENQHNNPTWGSNHLAKTEFTGRSDDETLTIKANIENKAEGKIYFKAGSDIMHQSVVITSKKVNMEGKTGSVIQTGGGILADTVSFIAMQDVDYQSEENVINIIGANIQTGDFTFTADEDISISKIIAGGSITISARKTTWLDHF